ncbi:MAG: hypothetical protein WDO71_02835 [Bacteroidota bacterium]
MKKFLVVNGRVSAIEPADTTMNVKFIDKNTGDYIIFAFSITTLSGSQNNKGWR